MLKVRKLLFLPVTLILAASLASADDWPQWRGPSRDGVWHESGIVETFDGPTLKIDWKADIGSGYSGPTVADGRVYVTDRVTEPKQIERVHCFDSRTGKKIWSYTYDCPYRGVGYEAGPRASVHLDEGRAYSLGTMGDLFCFDAPKGTVLWKKDLKSDYKIEMPTWGLAAAPLIEGNLLIVQVGGQEACLVAFDKKTGDEKWKSLDDPASYSAPIIVDQAGHRVLVCYTGHNVAGLDPQTGKVYWKIPFRPKQMVIGCATPVYHNGMIFVTNFFDGCMLIKLLPDKLEAVKVWERSGPSEKKTDGLQSIISTPYLEGQFIYGVDSYGELRCLDLKTGDRVWESLAAVPKARWATIHFVKNADHVWMFNERGELIISKLSPKGFTEISRAKLIAPTEGQLPQRDGVCWSHPAFANRHIFARNDRELVCASLARK
jgi:outer membrane protein assembly factor BamB